MKTPKTILPVAIMLFLSVFLAACSNSDIPSPAEPSGEPSSTDGASAGFPTDQVNQDLLGMIKDEKNYNWVVVVQDTTTTVSGPFETTVQMDLKATNASGGIEGGYSGSMTSSSISKNANYAATATSDKKTGAVEFSIGPVLAKLVPEDVEDDRLAPLVPSEEDALAPLTDPDDEPDYEGDGTISISNPTGTTQIQGMGIAAQKEHTSASGFPIHIAIRGAQVRMTMKTPQGDIYFNGFIRGEKK